MGRWQVADSIREHLGPGMLSPLKHQRSDDLCSTSSAPGLSKHHRSLRREDALGGYERQLKRPEDCSDTLEVKRYAPPPHTKKFIGPRLWVSFQNHQWYLVTYWLFTRGSCMPQASPWLDVELRMELRSFRLYLPSAWMTGIVAWCLVCRALRTGLRACARLPSWVTAPTLPVVFINRVPSCLFIWDRSPVEPRLASNLLFSGAQFYKCWDDGFTPPHLAKRASPFGLNG